MPTSEKFEPEIFLGTIHAVGSSQPRLNFNLVHPGHVLRCAWAKHLPFAGYFPE